MIHAVDVREKAWALLMQVRECARAIVPRFCLEDVSAFASCFGFLYFVGVLLVRVVTCRQLSVGSD